MSSTRTRFLTMASWLQMAPASSPEDPSSSKEFGHTNSPSIIWWSLTDWSGLDRLTVRCFYPLSGVHRLAVARNIRPQTSGVGSVKVLKTLEGSLSHNPTSQTAFDLKLKGSNHSPVDSDCGNVSSRHQNCQHRALVHQGHQAAGLSPGQEPLLPLLSGPQHQSLLHPVMSLRTPEAKTRQDIQKVPSHLGLREPQNQEVSEAAAQTDSDTFLQYQRPELSYPVSRRMTDLGRSGLIDKRNTETGQRIRVRPQRRVILPGKDLNSKVIEPGDVFPSWQTQYSSSAKQKSEQSAGLTGNSREVSPQKTILKPEAGTTFRSSCLRRSEKVWPMCRTVQINWIWLSDLNFRSFWCQSPAAFPSTIKTSSEDSASVQPEF